MNNSRLKAICVVALGLLVGAGLLVLFGDRPGRNELPEGPGQSGQGVMREGQDPDPKKREDETASASAAPPAPYRPPQVDDPRLAAFVDRESHAQRVHDDMTSKFPGLASERDIAAVVGVLKDRDEADDTVRHEAASMLARSGYKNLVKDLLGVLNDPKEKDRFRGWVVQHLQQNYEAVDRKGQDAIRGQLRTSLSDRDIHVRRESMLALYRISPEEALPLARECLRDPTGGADPMRDLAIRIVRERDDRDELAEVRKYARHGDVEVRRSALVTLAAWKDEESRSAMEEAAKSENALLRRCGELALKRLGKASGEGADQGAGQPSAGPAGDGGQVPFTPPAVDKTSGAKGKGDGKGF